MKKKSLQDIVYVFFLLAAIIVLFHWYTTRNQERIEERNKNYAADSAQIKADQIDKELSNALNRIRTYSYFVGEGLNEPVITAQMLKRMEENSTFDAMIFTDVEGTDYASDGRTADVTERIFYSDGINGGVVLKLYLILTFLMRSWHVFIRLSGMKEKS